MTCPVCRLARWIGYELELFRNWLDHHPRLVRPITRAGAWLHFLYFSAIVIGFKELYVASAFLLAVVIIVAALAGEGE